MFAFIVAANINNDETPYYRENLDWIAVQLLLNDKYCVFEYPAILYPHMLKHNCTCYSIYEYDGKGYNQLVWGRYDEFKKKLDEHNIEINKLNFRDKLIYDKESSTLS